MSFNIADEEREKIVLVKDMIKVIKENIIKMERELQKQIPSGEKVRDFAVEINRCSGVIIDEI